MCVTVCLCVNACVVLYQVCWNGEVYRPCELGDVLKWIMTVSTVVLVYQIIGLLICLCLFAFCWSTLSRVIPSLCICLCLRLSVAVCCRAEEVSHGHQNARDGQSAGPRYRVLPVCLPLCSLSVLHIDAKTPSQIHMHTHPRTRSQSSAIRTFFRFREAISTWA